MPSSRGSSHPRDGTCVSYVSSLGRRALYHSRHQGSPYSTRKWSEVAQPCSTLCNPMDCSPPGSSVHPWDFPDKGTGMSYHFLLQGIFPTQGSNPGLPHCRQILLSSEPPGKSIWYIQFSSVQFSSVAQSSPTLCDPMNHSTPGLPVHHQLPEFT